MKLQILTSTALLLCTVALNAQTTVGGITTFDKNKVIGKYKIPSNITKVVINADITLKGSFEVQSRNTALTIEGKNSQTSILEGSGNTDQDNAGINCTSKITLNLKNFTGKNPDWYHMRCISAKIVAEGVRLIDTRNYSRNNSDGFSGGDGSTFNNCYVDTWDDSFKIYYGSYTIKNTTIIHNKNGSPFQMGWGDGTHDTCTLTLENVTVKGNSSNGYTQGIFSWAGGSEAESRTIKGTITRTGDMSAKLYLFKKGTNNKKMNFSSGNSCPSTTNYSNQGGSGNKVTVAGCSR